MQVLKCTIIATDLDSYIYCEKKADKEDHTQPNNPYRHYFGDLNKIRTEHINSSLDKQNEDACEQSCIFHRSIVYFVLYRKYMEYTELNLFDMILGLFTSSISSTFPSRIKRYIIHRCYFEYSQNVCVWTQFTRQVLARHTT